MSLIVIWLASLTRDGVRQAKVGISAATWPSYRGAALFARSAGVGQVSVCSVYLFVPARTSHREPLL